MPSLKELHSRYRVVYFDYLMLGTRDACQKNNISPSRISQIKTVWLNRIRGHLNALQNLHPHHDWSSELETMNILETARPENLRPMSNEIAEFFTAMEHMYRTRIGLPVNMRPKMTAPELANKIISPTIGYKLPPGSPDAQTFMALLKSRDCVLYFTFGAAISRAMIRSTLTKLMDDLAHSLRREKNQHHFAIRQDFTDFVDVIEVQSKLGAVVVVFGWAEDRHRPPFIMMNVLAYGLVNIKQVQEDLEYHSDPVKMTGHAKAVVGLMADRARWQHINKDWLP